jgi:hypothetical protein
MLERTEAWEQMRLMRLQSIRGIGRALGGAGRDGLNGQE